MDILRCTTVLTTILLLSSSCTSQDLPKGGNVLLPPKHIDRPLAPFGDTLTQTRVLISWDAPPNANSYSVTIFKVENTELILHAEVKNVHDQRIEFNDLEPSTKYEIVIRSVRIFSDGSTETSENSKPYSFRTLDPCTGGMVHVLCDSHCTRTCEKQISSCDRRCVSGCGCPPHKPLLHNGECVPKKDCTSVIEVISRPTGLKVHRMKGSNDVLFTWKEVEGADFYTVTVMKKDGTVVQEIDNVNIPFLIIKDLTPKVRYRFRVQAKFRKFDVKRRDLPLWLLKPDAPTVERLTETSFFIEWDAYFEALSYKVVIDDPDTKETVQLFRNLLNTYVTIQGLSPGTTYAVSMIAVTKAGHEIESYPQTVTTLGEKGMGGAVFDPTEVIFVVEETTTSTTAAPTTTPYVATCADRKAALEAYLKSDPKEDVHVPDCDSGGSYRTRQCGKKGCYCVHKRSGEMRPGSNFESSTAKYALDCNRYGQFKISPFDTNVQATNTKTIKVRWQKQPGASFYIVKVFNGFQSGIVTHVSGITKTVAVIGGLSRGTAYIVTVSAVNKDGWTTSDNVKGKFIIMPHLDPPTDVKLEQVANDRMKVSWVKNDIALHHKVELFLNGEQDPYKTYENVTNDMVEFPAKSQQIYRVRVRSTGVTTIPGSGKTMLVASNGIDISRRSTCVLPAMDILFVLDVSNKMSPKEYGQVKNMYTELVKSLTPISKSRLDTSGTRIAAVKAYDSARAIFRYDRFGEVSNLVGALSFVKQTKFTKLNVGRMLNYVYNTFFSASNNDDQRKKVATAVITFLGGRSDDDDFGAQAARLRSVTNVITVGVKGIVDGYSMSMASPRDLRIEIPSYDDIELAYDMVMERLCKLK